VVGRLWTGFMWLRTGITGRLFQTQLWIFIFTTIRISNKYFNVFAFRNGRKYDIEVSHHEIRLGIVGCLIWLSTDRWWAVVKMVMNSNIS